MKGTWAGAGAGTGADAQAGGRGRGQGPGAGGRGRGRGRGQGAGGRGRGQGPGAGGRGRGRGRGQGQGQGHQSLVGEHMLDRTPYPGTGVQAHRDRAGAGAHLCDRPLHTVRVRGRDFGGGRGVGPAVHDRRAREDALRFVHFPAGPEPQRREVHGPAERRHTTLGLSSLQEGGGVRASGALRPRQCASRRVTAVGHRPTVVSWPSTAVC